MRRFVTVLCILTLAGCAQPIAYRNVNFEDGVYDAEILSIAAHELEVSQSNRFSSKGKIIDNRFTKCLENHKLVVFPSRTMFAKERYYVIVHSQTGLVAKTGTQQPTKNVWAAMVRGIEGCYE